MMKTPQLLVLLLLLLAVVVASGFPGDRRGRDKQASWDDVNVVAHGLLQLGQGLKEHVDKTKAQMRDVVSTLKAFNGSVVELERRQQEKEEDLRARDQEVEQREKLEARMVEEVKTKVEEVRKETRDLHSRMDRLEEVLVESTLDGNNSDQAGVPLIQRLVAAQNRRIDQLVDKIQQQQDKLEKQSLHLQALQSKVALKRVKFHRRRDEETALKGEAEQINNQSDLATDCHDLFVRGERTSGVYSIQPENSQPFNVFCEMTSDGGWTIIQKRQDGFLNFNQLWESYKKGFGDLNGEFWLGLDNIHSVSKQGKYVLQVELTEESGRRQEVRFQFHLDGEEKKFALHLDQDSSSGVQDKAMSSGASGLPFSTADSDNDLDADVNCAELLSGGWWFSSCGESNLNGKYPRRPSEFRRQKSRRQAMFWTTSEGRRTSLKSTLLKIKPASSKQ